MDTIDSSYAEVEGLLVAVLRVPPEARMRLRSRVQHLQRANFPKGAKVGRGARHRYNRKDSFQLLFAFVLMDLGWTSLVVAQFLEEHWAAFDKIIVANLGNRRPTADERREGRLLLNPKTLGSISPGLTDEPATQPYVAKSPALARTLASCIVDVAEITRLAVIHLKARS